MGDNTAKQGDGFDSPIDFVEIALGKLVEIHRAVASGTPDDLESADDFISGILNKVSSFESSGEELEKDFCETLSDASSEIAREKTFIYFNLVYIICRYCMEAVWAVEDDDFPEAWKCTSIAQYYTGMLIGCYRPFTNPVVEMTRKAAYVRHAENRETAIRIKDWYLENKDKYRSMDKAAEAAIKIEPVSFRTARKHIGEAAKKLRSARKK